METKMNTFYISTIFEVDIPIVIDFKFQIYYKNDKKIFYKPIDNEVCCNLYYVLIDEKNKNIEDWKLINLPKKIYYNNQNYEYYDFSKIYDVSFFSHHHNKFIWLRFDIFHLFSYIGILNIEEMDIEVQVSTIRDDIFKPEIKSRVLNFDSRTFSKIHNINLDMYMLKKGEFKPFEYNIYNKYYADNFTVSQIFYSKKDNRKNFSYEEKIKKFLMKN